ncbi:hypothetical protein SanaruYs_14750 [Chryseotalea sanaruensis]|uniref:N-acetyltransferase n=1 Tax=Chryseotalea sanaruensis TaxID=2482724 RepID=A0A401U8P6_9BACT|nr:hypothetical protein [Chryseotalea sanaruensis]GCC51254.1 hypothetical protein SanaruYs_14750 [Chryseotalea sanaruensis]
MRIIEVTTQAHIRAFLDFPVSLYKNHHGWIRPLDNDIEAVFDKKKNKTFQHGQCIRWIVEDEAGAVVGRVAAFVNDKTTNKGNEQPTGGLGFFDCINNQEVAFLLFDTCKNWLQAKGMEAMDGPINFGNRDKWWGLLVEGFEREPNYQCNYNFPYYKEFFETYGFQVYFYQLTFGRPMMGDLDSRLQVKADVAAKNPDYSFRYISKSDNTLADKIRYVYNKAWAKRGEIPELTETQAKHIVKQMKPIMDEKLLWFAFYKDEPVAFFLSLPEVNQIFKHVNGKLNLLGKLKFVYHRWRKTNKKAFGILFGVVPEHQGKGVDGGMIMAFKKVMQEEYLRYEEYEMNWIGDFNSKMIRVAEQVTPNVVKRHATYRKLFDSQKEFKRYPIMNV